MDAANQNSLYCLSSEFLRTVELPMGSYPDSSFLHRVKRAYFLALTRKGPAGKMWDAIDARRTDVHAALLASTDTELRKIFADPISTDLFYGVDNLCRSVNGSRNEYVQPGFICDESPSFSRLAAVLHSDDDCEGVLGTLDKTLCQHVEFPAPFRGELGHSTSRGPASYRAIQALYQTWRLFQLVGPKQSIVEIGPGMGRTAYYAYRAGLTDYTTIDLPLGVVAQACFLGAVLGADKIWLEGDEGSTDGRIKLLSTKPKRQFDIALNVDSLTEMPPSVAADYAGWISQQALMFLSINHEHNLFNVADIGRTTFLAKDKWRIPYPMRDEYFEELFLLTGRQRFFGAQRLSALAFLRGVHKFLRQRVSRL